MPKEPDLPEDGPEFRRAMKRVVWPWAVPGLVIALVGVVVLFASAFASPIGAGLFALGFGLELVGLVKGRRFRKAFIASHPL